MNVIARLEYELAYYDSAVHRFNHYTTRTPPQLGTVPSAQTIGSIVTLMFRRVFFFFSFLGRAKHLPIISFSSIVSLWYGGTAKYSTRQVYFFIFIFFVNLFVWVLWQINLCWLFNAKSIFKQIISPISNSSIEHKYTV